MSDFFKTKFKQYKAFTLAEVLITLGVIGVVAALTIPALKNYIDEKTFLTQFQTAYSDLSQAYTLSAKDNGTADTWGTQPYDGFVNMKPYLKLDGANASYYPPYNVQKLQGGSATAQYYCMILANGSTIGFDYDDGMQINLDTNGLKGPNRWGYDYFTLLLNSRNGAPFVSWPYYGGWVEDESTWCNKSNTSASWANGVMCSYWVIKHGNMDYMHRDLTDAEWSK